MLYSVLEAVGFKVYWEAETLPYLRAVCNSFEL